MSPVATPKPPAASHSTRQSSPPPEPVHVEPKEDAEGEEEGEEGEEDDAKEDNNPYCFCQRKKIPGDMIACVGSNCPYEWFHLSCVGLKPGQLDEGAQWFCEVCKRQIQKKRKLKQPQSYLRASDKYR
ncbi:hypothetical protein CYLTODRAFT_412657 [Cylindrobasidium torrendii FP15055 ss-10]|uniref:Zinc finger PHD-type domain-containing protein n=1 Tax=Cylindrobasidium torrendii FP15055 ss-10 TaxID=1314674 RepID=A0A0D7B766_9AGAR|nr:hypothetical protein CYLTODRAFT_412657 [Cylindrobasidium torrendii FP15055 ss-10]